MPWWSLAVALLVALLLRRQPLAQSAAIGICVFLLGILLTTFEHQRLTFPDRPSEQTLHAVVLSEPAARPHSVSADLLLTGNGRRVKASFATDHRSLSLRPGDGLLLRTVIRPTAQLRLGTFDYGRYLLVHGFTGRCYLATHSWRPQPLRWNTLAPGTRLQLRALRWRHSLLTRYADLTASTPSAYALISAMTLGHRSSLTADQRELFSVTGAAHVLALSGLHMAILFSILTLLTRPSRSRTLTCLFLILAFWAFALLTGLSVSVVRSALMLSTATLFSLRGGRSSTINALSLAALVILIANPLSLFDAGFQLSFISVLSILLLMPVVDTFLSTTFFQHHRWLRLLCNIEAVALAAQVGTAPLIAYYFGRLPMLSFVTNLAVLPCAWAIFSLSLCWLLLPVAILGRALLAVVAAMTAALSAIAAMPYASIGDLHPTPLQVLMCYIFLFALWMIVVKIWNIRIDRRR